MIRPATHDDLAGLVEFAMSCNDVMPWKTIGIGPDLDSTISNMIGLVESKKADISIVDLGQGISGVCAVELAPFPWNKNLIMGYEWIWHMAPQFPEGLTKRKWVIKMLDHMMDWARGHGANAFKTGTIHNDKALLSLLKRKGIVQLETECAGRL